MYIRNMHLRVPGHKVPSQKKPSQQSGISLVEVIVSILILSIGLLGMAALQNTSLKLAYDSYLRTQASFLAYDLIDRIRTNPGFRYDLSETANITEKNCFAGDNCTPGDLQQHDLHFWKKQAEELLPGAKLELKYDNAVSTYSMKLRWSDRYDDDVENDESKEFVYHFRVEANP